MLSTLILLHYNNYYNRIIKREATLSAYREYQIGEDKTSVNFIPNDYINTTQIVNWSYEDPDYLLVLDDDSNIISRWFVISATRLRSGQLQLELHRDLIVDYYDHLISAPMFIEKATIKRINDSAIYNKEDMTFNQIKTAEYLLKDRSNTAWIVGYIPRDSFLAKDYPTGATITSTYNYTGADAVSVATLKDYTKYPYLRYTDNDFVGNYIDVKYGVNTFTTVGPGNPAQPGNRIPGTFTDDFTASIDREGNYLGTSDVVNKGSYNYTGNRTYRFIGNSRYINVYSQPHTVTIDGNAVFAGFTYDVMSTMNRALSSYLTAEHTNAEVEDFLAQDGKIIFDQETQLYYQVSIVRTDYYNKEVVYVSSGTIYNEMRDHINQNLFSGTINNQTFQVSGSAVHYRLSLTALNSKLMCTVPNSSERYHLNDSPYDMFCIPFPAEGQQLGIKFMYQTSADTTVSANVENVDRLAGFNIATSIAKTLGQGNIYDIQLLPYCPIQGIIKADGTLDAGNRVASAILTEDPVGPRPGAAIPVSVILWATASEFRVNIPFTISQSSTILDKKVKNETEMWRLCSPNYSGVFEFSPEKNDGVSYISVDCNYKPFSPYIHANINFKNLYGQDFHDSRGLICGGDFSLPQVTDAWADYQLQNKNYQQMFDRQIQNMEVTNSVQRSKEALGAITGAIGGAAAGAIAGAKKGGVYGAVAGGVIGAAGSVIGSAINYDLNEQLRNEALDYKTDMFGYQLQNIQALPQGIAKVSAFTANNKIFPFLEKYECTEDERNALINKLRYNGMTIMRIGTIDEFLQTSAYSYIKGRLIRVESINEDYHIINAIADELYKGVYI